ncbi:CpsD/CapB family tyrosine-protein kinase [Cohnella kolymensis]|uniref:CpsD/CapB family tyrosine-protein kinase n=1 Tax=Cohnella kolymensis TaxID=1590652 RepID=UPI0009E27188|nr:CpsD/CapB family tyrosine-protein kinase [Cohnella kolymensis]
MRRLAKKVILIDADLRKPSVHLTFRVHNGKGLSNVLGKQNGVTQVVMDTNIENLTFMPAGPIPVNPSELLASKTMEAMLAELTQRYEMIIFDCTPVLTQMDAKIVTAICDGTLLVVEYGKSKRNMAKKVKEELVHARANLVGVVMTKIKKKDAKNFFFQ